MKYDFCILGAGLAGLSLAKELKSISDAKVVVIDPNGIANGASGSPLGLSNPATGRYATKSWRAEESLQACKNNLEEVSSYSSELFYSQSGVIRPAMDSKIARRMQENLESNNWPDDWCEWLSEDEIKTRFPDLQSEYGGVWVSQGITVAIPEYLQALSKYLNSKKIDIFEQLNYELNRISDSWVLDFQSSKKIEAKHLIVTAGIKTQEFDFWKYLPLHAVKGQVAIFEAESEFPYSSAVSALGYFASIDSKTFVAGSTYEHNFVHEQPDENGLTYIEDRMLKVMPEMKGKYRLIKQWSGVRASTPDRKPIVGSHPNIKDCSVFTGLGSKGLLYSSILAKDLARSLINGDTIPDAVSPQRF